MTIFIFLFLLYISNTRLQENVLNTSTISQTIYSHELPFASILEIYNASYADTGYYYCGPVGQDIFKSDGMYGQDRNISMYRVAKIYLYVSGRK